MTTRVSIALATYNGEKYLAEQLQSFIAQSHLPDEVIISDDCSSDSTVVIAKVWAKHAPFNVIINVNKKNIGYSRNFSNALELCTGDIVFLSDQDDSWLPTKIETMLDYFESYSDTQLLIHDIEYCKDNLSPIGQTKIQRMENSFNLEQHFIVGMASAVRKNFLKLCLPINIKVAHDNWIHQCVNVIGGKMILNEVLALHRRHSSNVTNTRKLNVNFVTTPDHFKSNVFQKLQKLATHSSDVKSLIDYSLLNWMKEKQKILVENNYISNKKIESLITIEVAKLERIEKRYFIISLPRWNRMLPVFQFYFNGQYAFFNGWKSAVKDILCPVV